MFTGFLFIFELRDHGLESAKRQLQELLTYRGFLLCHNVLLYFLTFGC